MKYNLQNICRVANRLRKEVKRSEAFTRAWKLAKQGVVEKVVGVKFSNVQSVLRELDHYKKTDVQIQVEHDWGNPWDDNACVVLASVFGQNQRVRVGYLSSKNAVIWANLMDQGVKVSSVLQEIVGGWDVDIAYGMRIRLQL
jgi:hypothetical protein